MKWYEIFKVGQKVKVTKKVSNWNYKYGTMWNEKYMDGTVGKIYEIIKIDKKIGYRLNTQLPVNFDNMLYNYWYPAEALEKENVKGEQLLFGFMKG